MTGVKQAVNKGKEKALLLTGVTGFLGSDVLARLIQQLDSKGQSDSHSNTRICVVARNKPDAKKSILAMRLREYGLDPDYEINRLDWRLTNFEDPLRFRNTLQGLDSGLSWKVLHMAAIIKASAQNASQKRLNQGVTEDLLEWANSRQAPFYYTSSVVAFGVSKDSRVRTEADFDHWEKENDSAAYYITKRVSHQHVEAKAKFGGALFCPSVVHGSLEHFKNSRSHLLALREGRLSWAPAGGANFVDLSHVSQTIVETLLGDAKSKVETLLLVGENLLLRDYFELYLSLWTQFSEKSETSAAQPKRAHIKRIPRWVGKPAFLLGRLLNAAGTASGLSHLMLTLSQSSSYLYFNSEKLQRRDSKEKLQEAILSSFEQSSRRNPTG